MKILELCLVSVLLCGVAYANSDSIIQEINNKQTLWKAGRNFPEGTPLSDMKRLLGVKKSTNHYYESIPVKYDEPIDDIPESFDARTKWPHCKSISKIYDQSACGSCWAIAATSTINDRICIHSNGKQQPELSTRNLIACAPSGMNGGHGCGGGDPYFSWYYWQRYGIVTGGTYEDQTGCQPYTFPSCDHVGGGSRPKCPIQTYRTPHCFPECDNSSLNYFDELIKGESAYRIDQVETHIQQEILKNGPVVASFSVFKDFFYYKNGIYDQTSDELAGSHAARILGWGVENNTKYWLVANSWNEDWGDNGLFKILRGVNLCFIESDICAGLPK